jgi:hypothetical protein
MFLCCASSDFQQTQIEINPLERFWQAYGEELDIRKIPLTPLSGKDIAEHLEGIFPSFAMPANFEMELAEITQGNPLFLSEILSKLVHDQKIVLTGQQWTVRSLEQNYLPTSLDEIISEKIALFDEESRRILDHASTFGESVSLSMLTGSSQIMESHVLDFLDKATAYGLVSSDFRFDDDNIRFLSKRVQEFVYGSIQQEKKEKLHEKIALYQEKLFEQRLLPSAAILAWHFTRSANLEKARIYEQQHTQYNSTLFVVEEAVNYIGDGDAPTSDIPLNASSLKDLPHFFRSLLSALRGTKLYPAGSKARIDALRQIRVVLDRILADRSHLRIAADKDSLIVNGEAIDTSEFKSIADQFRNLFISVDLSSVTIRKDCSERDMDAMLEAIGMVDRRKIHPQFWEEVCEERGLTGIELKQVRYARVDTEDGEQEEPMVPAMQDGEAMLQAMQGIEYGLCSADLASISQVIGSLMGAHSKIKLYPMESSVITDAISQVMAALDEFLSTRPFLTLAAVDASLLVNGVKVDTQNFEALAASFVRFLQSIRLNSVTFLKHVSSKDVVTFLKTVLQHTTSELSTEFWRRFTKEMKITGILFDRSFYTVMEEMTAGVAEENPAENEMREDFDSVPDQEISGTVESFQDMQKDPSADDLAGTLKDLFLRGEEKQLSLFLKMTFQNYVLMPPSHRKHLAEACQKALSPGEFVPIPRFLRLIAEHLQGAIEKEEDPNILELLAILLQQMSFSFLQYGEYSLASWLFVIIKERFRELGESGSGQYHLLSQTIREPLPPHALAGLWDDMKSTVPALQQEATLFLSSMDERILPLLIDVTKKENDLRVRQLMAGLIGKLGIEAADTFKRELVLEVAAEERVRMLDVADMVSRDLHVELSYALTDEKTQARRAAFRLAERLQDEQTVELLCDYAQAEDGDKAIPAIRSLGRMKAAQAVSVLIAVLNKTSDHDVQMACCQSLGQIADPACMDMLIRILTPRGLLSLQKKYSDNLRATAAFALSQIPHPRVSEVMKSFSEDNDLRIRRTARAVLTGGTGQPRRKE